MTQGEITIVDDVWIGAHVTALPNVTIDISSVTGTWIVVTSDIQSFSITAGVPVKVIKQRKK